MLVMMASNRCSNLILLWVILGAVATQRPTSGYFTGHAIHTSEARSNASNAFSDPNAAGITSLLLASLNDTRSTLKSLKFLWEATCQENGMGSGASTTISVQPRRDSEPALPTKQDTPRPPSSASAPKRRGKSVDGALIYSTRDLDNMKVPKAKGAPPSRHSGALSKQTSVLESIHEDEGPRPPSDPNDDLKGGNEALDRLLDPVPKPGPATVVPIINPRPSSAASNWENDEEDESGYKSDNAGEPAHSQRVMLFTPSMEQQQLRMRDCMWEEKAAFMAGAWDRIAALDEQAINEEPRDPDKGRLSISEFAQRLTSAVSGSKLSILRLIFRWIAAHIRYDCDHHNLRRPPVANADLAFRERKAVAAGYAELLSEMYSAVGIQCEMIHGVAKGRSYYPGRRIDPSDLNDAATHQWNRVKLGERFYLLDVTWAAGYRELVGERMTFQFDYDDFWFLVDPQVFVYTHLPMDYFGTVQTTPQLLNSPWRDFPAWQEALSHSPQGKALRFEPISHRDGVVRSSTNSLTLHFRCKYDVDLKCLLLDVGSGKHIRDHLMAARNEDIYSVYCRLPHMGQFAVKVFAQPLFAEPGMRKEWRMYTYRVEASDQAITAPFPSGIGVWGCHARFLHAGFKVLNHTKPRIETVQGKASIELQTPTIGHFPINFRLTSNRHGDTPLERSVYAERWAEGRVVFHIVCWQPGEYRFCIQVRYQQGGEFELGANYLVVCEAARTARPDELYPRYDGLWGPTRVYHEDGFKLAKYKSSTVLCPKGSCDIVLRRKYLYQVSYMLLIDNDEQQDWERCVYAEAKKDGTIVFHVLLPASRRYRFTILTSRQVADDRALVYDPSHQTYHEVANLLLECETPWEHHFFFPLSHQWGALKAMSDMNITMEDFRSSTLYTEEAVGGLTLYFTLNRRVRVFFRLLGSEIGHEEALQQCIVGERRGNTVLLHLSFFRTGVFHLQLLAAEEIHPLTNSDVVANYLVHCDCAAPAFLPYEPHEELFHHDVEEMTRLGVRRVDSQENIVHVLEGGRYTVSLETASADLELTHQLVHGRADVARYCYARRRGDRIDYELQFPERGFYKLLVSSTKLLFVLLIGVRSPCADVTLFPDYARSWGVKPAATALGLSLSHIDSSIVPVDGEFALTVENTHRVEVVASLEPAMPSPNPEQRLCHRFLFKEEEPSSVLLRMAFPEPGMYVLVVRASLKSQYAGLRDVESKSDIMARYLVQCDAPLPERWIYPQWSNFYTGCHIVSPRADALPATMAQTFEFVVPEAEEVTVDDPDSDWLVTLRPVQGKPGVWRVTTNVGDPKQLWITARFKRGDSRGNQYGLRQLLRYHVRYEGPLGAGDNLQTFGLSLLDPDNTPPTLKARQGCVELFLRGPLTTQLFYRLMKEGVRSSTLRGAIVGLRCDNVFKIIVRLPRAGVYRLKLSARDENLLTREDVAMFVIESDSAAPAALPFMPHPEEGLYGSTMHFHRYEMENLSCPEQPLLVADHHGNAIFRIRLKQEIVFHHQLEGQDGALLNHQVRGVKKEAESVIDYFIFLARPGYYRFTGRTKDHSLFSVLLHAPHDLGEEAEQFVPYPDVDKAYGLLPLGSRVFNVSYENAISTLVAQNGLVVVRFSLEDSEDLRFELSGPQLPPDEGGVFLFLEREKKSSRTLFVAPPRAGYFLLRLVHRATEDADAGVEEKELGTWLIDGRFVIGRDTVSFPQTLNFYEGCQLLSPRSHRLRPNVAYVFKMVVPGADEVYVMEQHTEWRQHLARQNDALWEGRVNVGEPKELLLAAVPRGGESGYPIHLLRYVVQFKKTTVTNFLFDQLGLYMMSDVADVYTTDSGRLQIRIGMTFPIALRHSLFIEGARHAEQLWSHVAGELLDRTTVVYHLQLPTTGYYRLTVRAAESEERQFREVASFLVQCTKPCAPFYPIPQFAGLFGPTASMEASVLEREGKDRGVVSADDGKAVLTFHTRGRENVFHLLTHKGAPMPELVYAERYDDLVNYVVETPHAGYYLLSLRDNDNELANYLVFSDSQCDEKVHFPTWDRIWGLTPDAAKLWVHARARGSTIRTHRGLTSLVFELQSRCKLRALLEGPEGSDFSTEDAAQCIRDRCEKKHYVVKLAFHKTGRFKLTVLARPDGDRLSDLNNRKSRVFRQSKKIPLPGESIVGIFLIVCGSVTQDELFKELLTSKNMYNPNAPLLTYEELVEARAVVQASGLCIRTPMIQSAHGSFDLPANINLYIKMEASQNSGSFKVRGLSNQLHHLPPDVGRPNRKLVTMSAGNYGRAFASACQSKRLSGLVLLPKTAPEDRLAILKGMGVAVEMYSTPELQDRVDEYVKFHNMHYLHPFDDIHVISGHGSLGLEILEDVPDPDVLLICCGGGGLLAGTAAAVKLSGVEKCRIYGVEPEGSNTMWESFREGFAVKKPGVSSIASGLSPPYAGPNAFRHCREFVDDIILVTDEDLWDTLAQLYNAGIVIEPSGAAAMAALLSGKVPDVEGKKVVVVLTGRNISPSELAEVTERAAARPRAAPVSVTTPGEGLVARLDRDDDRQEV